MEHTTVSIQSIEKITHDVLRMVIHQPQVYNYQPEQATEPAVDEKKGKLSLCIPTAHVVGMVLKQLNHLSVGKGAVTIEL